MEPEKGRILIVDPSMAGIAGDMFSAALIDTIDDEIFKKIKNAILQLELASKFEMSLQSSSYQGIEGKKLELANEHIRIDAENLEVIFEHLSDELQIKEKYRNFGKQTISILLNAEKEVHKSSKIKLHELGTIDTIIDVVIPSFILQYLKIDQIIINPIATGFGTVNTAHGKLPIPVPAVNYILTRSGLPQVQGPQGEATTPTGAALLYSLKKIFPTFQNSYVVKQTGIGFGKKQWQDRGNYLQIRLSESSKTPSKIVVLETNLDDVDGEVLGYAMDKLMEEGALDVSYYPIVMKKNRPAYCLRVLTTIDRTEKFADKMMKLTGSLGIRVTNINRHIGDRDIITHEFYVKEIDSDVKFRTKHSKYGWKIEFDDLVKLAEDHNLSIRDLKNILTGYVNKRLRGL